MSVIIQHSDTISKLQHQLDDTAFIKIYTTYWTKLYTIAYNRLNSKQAAEDVVQEVMLGLWQRQKEEDIDNLEAWLSAATRYSVFRQLAKFGTEKIQPISPSNETSYHQDFDSVFIKEILQQQINQLPEKCKLVFQYSRNHSLSNKEIAGKMDISEKSVEKHITKALVKLRNNLKKAISMYSFLAIFFFEKVG